MNPRPTTSPRLTFCGAAGTVTGSCYWLHSGRTEFLVDCGLFQGSKTLKELNYGPLPFEPASLSFVLLTHAHIDHSGLLPRLVRHGFTGPIYASAGTRDLLTYLLPDSASIHEMEVERLNRRNLRRGRPQVLPIFSAADAERTIELIQTVSCETWIDIQDDIRARFWDAGHILGSTSIEIEMATGDKSARVLRLLFSGDIGPDNKLFQSEPEGPSDIDYLISESTYGNRRRPVQTAEQRRTLLAGEVERAMQRGGNLLIPTFAVERTQELLYDLCVLFDRKTIPPMPVFLDSPLAIRATEVFSRHSEQMGLGDGNPDPFRRPNIHFTPSPAESMAINRLRSGAIVLAGSGMCEAGRIRHHLKENLWRSECTVLLVGYQAPGTLGSLLENGATTVRIQGDEVRVKAEIRCIDAYSGHADSDGLARWIKSRFPVRRAIFLTHGEEAALQALKSAVETLAGLDLPVLVPQLDDAYDLLGRRGTALRRTGPRRLQPTLVGQLDWHNDLADLSIRLRDTLEAMTEERDRTRLLHRLRKTIDSAGR